MKSVKILLTCLVIILVFSTLAYAEVPKMINYQGKITTPQGALISDTFSMVFSIYADSTGGTALWTETQPSVKVEFGVFSVLLGSVNPIPATVFDGDTRYLGLKVGNDNEMTPRKAIVSVGYAYHSGTADTAHFAMPDADWVIDGDNIYREEGNVGIGTTNPIAKLDVAGAIKTSNDIIAGSPGNEFIFHSRSDLGSDFLQITDQENYGGWKWGQGITLRKNGNVGIGTESPGAKLDVNGLTRSIAYSGGSVDLSGVSNPDIRFISGSSDYRWEAGSDGSFYLYDQNATAYRLFLNSSGNVGIGTANPAYKLDVNGDIRSTGTIYGNFSGTMDNALHWNGHSWGDTYPYSSNSDMVDGIHGTQFLRNDQSGTLNGSLTVNGPGGSINAITGNTNGDYSGVAGSNTGAGPGVYGETWSSAGNDGGVHGRAHVDGGSAVYGETFSLGVPGGSSVAIYGWAPQSGASVGGAALGVLGRVNSYQGTSASVPAGVFGWATATSGINAGVFGETASPDGFGVYSKGKLEVNGNINTNGTITAGSSSSKLGIGTYSPTHRIDVQGGAYCSGTNWVNASSRKYKKDISSLTPQEYQDILEKLLETDVVRYQYKSESNGKVHIGIIAEDAPEEIVDAERTGIPTGDAIGFLLAALKAQQEEIRVLKAKLEKLESSR